jgi:hypothetical protein
VKESQVSQMPTADVGVFVIEGEGGKTKTDETRATLKELGLPDLPEGP